MAFQQLKSFRNRTRHTQVPIIIAVITDSSANIISAIWTLFGKNKHILCFAHTVNLIAQSVTNDEHVEPTHSKLREILKWAKRSVNVSDKLRNLQIQSAVPEGNVKKLILDVKTRWHCSYYIIERFF